MIDVLGHDSALLRLYWAGDNWANTVRWTLLWIMLLVQDQSLNLLTSNPARYHWATDAYFGWKEKQGNVMYLL